MYVIGKERMNDAYKSGLTAIGVSVLCFVTKKTLGKKWELVPIETPWQVVKLTVALALVGTGVDAIQDRKWLPTEPFKVV